MQAAANTTNCAACVADTTCGWCGNDPYHAGGFGFTAQGDHTEGNPFSEDAYMIGGIGKVILDSAQGETVTGRNTVFTKQFRGKSSINVDGGLYDGSSPPEVTSSPNVDMDSALEMGTNPFRLKVTVNGTECEFEIREVTSDTEMSLIAPASSQCSFHSDYVAFAPGRYALSWRWDCEQTSQVWAHCSAIDIKLPSSESHGPQIRMPTDRDAAVSST